MSLLFEHEPIILLSPALIALMGVLYWLNRRRSRTLRRFILRAFTCLLLVLVLAHPVFEHSRSAGEILFLADISDSMDVTTASGLASRLEGVRGDARIRTLPFASQPGIPIPDLVPYEELKQSWERLDMGGTDLFEALNSLPHGTSEVVLLSDGYPTSSTDDAIIAVATSRQLRVSPLLPDAGRPGERTVRLSNLHAPLVAPAETSVEVRASIRNTTDTPQDGLLTVMHEEKKVLEQRVTIPAGRELLVVAPSDPSKEGVKKVTATFTPADSTYTPSSATVFLAGERRERVLVLSGASEDERLLKQILEGRAYRVESLIPSAPEQVPQEFSRYSTVILNNLPYARLGKERAQRLAEWIEKGGGMIMIGGNTSFGLGGYIDTSIERTLPVRLVPPRTQPKRLNVAVTLVIDKSRSMAEGQRLDYAKEAAKEVIRNLKDEDYIGVIGFDSTPFVVVKLDLVGRIRDAALGRVDRLFSAGRTNLLPALEEARRALEVVPAGRKHMLVLTDGKLPDAGPFYTELSAQMRLSGITMSTVLLGSADSDETLETMARNGGGSFYHSGDVRALPRIFLTDIRVHGAEKTLQESQQFSVRRKDLRSTTVTGFPPVKGIVEVREREEATLELAAEDGAKSFPLLASWGVGRGKVVAFTSDVSGRWTRLWASWPRFHQFWEEVFGAVRRQGGEDEVTRFDLRYFVENGELLLDLAIFSEIGGKGVEGEILTPDGQSHAIPFSAAGPGRYTGALPRAMAGKYELKMRTGGRPLTPVAFQLPGELFGERKGLGYRTAFLRQLAEATGGTVNPSLEEIVAERNVIEKTDLRPFLFALAVALILWEIALREGFALRFTKRAKA
jgi:Ca-activated chloride channel homolog